MRLHQPRRVCLHRAQQRVALLDRLWILPLRILPPLIVEESHIREAIDVIETCAKEFAS